jgi:hypothetical protein
MSGPFNLKNLTIITVVLLALGAGLAMVNRTGLSEACVVLAISGFMISYYLYAVISWDAGHAITAALMLTVPGMVYFLSSGEFSGSVNVIPDTILLFVGCGTGSAILLLLSGAIYTGITRFMPRTETGSDRGFHPHISYVVLGMIVISLIVLSTGSTARFSENMDSVLRSTDEYLAGAQNSLPAPSQDLPAASPVTRVAPAKPDPGTVSGPANGNDAGLTARTFGYILRGQSGTIPLDLNAGVYTEISSEPAPAACIRYDGDTTPCTGTELRQYYLKYIDEPDQEEYLDTLVNSIKAKTPVQDDQARIAISLVQQIPYDYAKLEAGSTENVRYPYEVLYDDKGVCEEKSLLLAYLLKALGYGVVLFEYPSEDHMAVGIQSPAAYAYRDTGYAFVETTQPTILTDDEENYIGIGKLAEFPNIYTISGGRSLNSVSEEYDDANSFEHLESLSAGSGGVLNLADYNEWVSLVRKYGLKISP